MFDIPAWPDISTETGKIFFLNAREIFAAWKAKKVSNPFAFGMLAQAEAESSCNPNAMGDHDKFGHPTAFALYQWHLPRLFAIRRATGIDIHADVVNGTGDIPHQIDGAWWELNNFAWLGLKAISSQTTAYGAAMQACALFERAGALDAAQRRGHLAERWLGHAIKEKWI